MKQGYNNSQISVIQTQISYQDQKFNEKTQGNINKDQNGLDSKLKKDN